MNGDSDQIAPSDQGEPGGFNDIFCLPSHVQPIVDRLRAGEKPDQIPDLCQKDDGNDNIGTCPGSGGGWNIIPGGAPAGCRKNLIVLIEKKADMLDRILAALKHIMVTCRDTTDSLLFYVSNLENASDWWENWDKLSACFAVAADILGISIYVEFQTQINWRAMLSEKFREAPNGRLAECRKHLQSFGPTVRRALLIDVLEFATQRLGTTDNLALLRETCGRQPAGCDGVPVLAFGKINNSGEEMLPGTWVLSITLRGPVRVILPDRYLDTIWDVDHGADSNFSPTSTEDFRIDPDGYICSTDYP